MGRIYEAIMRKAAEYVTRANSALERWENKPYKHLNEKDREKAKLRDREELVKGIVKLLDSKV